MDEIKLFLPKENKHFLFWILITVALVLGFVFWFLGYRKVSADYEARISELEQLKSQVAAIGPGTPNPGVIDATSKQVELLKAEVLSAWDFLYRVQKAKNRWPEALSPQFRRVINSLRPGDEIPELYREEYLNFIEDHFPSLFEIIDLRHRKDQDLKELVSLASGPTAGTAAGGYPGYTGGYPGATGYEAYGAGEGEGEYGGEYGAPGMTSQEMVGTVEWDPASIGVLKSRFAWQSVPDSQTIWDAQEDLWVYEALLRVIRDTNEGATGFHNAAIKKIEELSIGPEAAQRIQSGRSVLFSAGAVPGGSGTAMMGSGYEGEGEYEYEGGEGGEMMGPPGYGLPQQRARYVDADGNPVPPGSDPPFAEFKMMPVYLRLIMDQRRIDRLLVNCANSSMPVRVTRVAIRPEKTVPADLGRLPSAEGAEGEYGYEGEGGYEAAGYGEYGGGGYGAGGYGAGYGGGYGAGYGGGYGEGEYEGGSGYGMGGASDLTNQLGGEYSPYDLRVEVEGIIYIFNPPDREKLGTGTESDTNPENDVPETSPVPAGVPGATPAAPSGPAPGPTPPAGTTPAGTPVPGTPAPGGPAPAPAGTPAAAPGAPAGPPAVPGTPAPNS